MKNDTDREKTVILCDFDGTILENDGCDLLMEHFASENWEEAGKRYLRKEISHAVMNDSFARDLKGTRKEFHEIVVNKAKVRRGFQELINFTKEEQNLHVVVISAGWDLYIQAILSNLTFSLVESFDNLVKHFDNELPEIPLIANRIVNNTTKRNWKINTPWKEFACQLSTPCKGLAVDALHKAGYQVVAIGNSETDMCMAEKADLVFATESLVSHLNDRSIFHQPFDDFFQIIHTLNQSLVPTRQ